MAEYYFLASLFPRLEIGHVPTLGFAELKELLRVNLTPEDAEKARSLLQYIDLLNLRALWAKEPLDPRGNYSKHELELALVNGAWDDKHEFPIYLRDYLDKYSTDLERLRHFPVLLSQFFEDKVEHEEGFLRDYFAFQREWQLVMVGFRAKKIGKNIDAELQFEDPADPIVAQILAQKDAKTYEPPFEYKELKPLFDAYENSPLELNKALNEYQFQRIVEFQDTQYFSIDRVLGYMARLLLVERWLELDVQKGIEVIDTIERNVV